MFSAKKTNKNCKMALDLDIIIVKFLTSVMKTVALFFRCSAVEQVGFSSLPPFFCL